MCLLVDKIKSSASAETLEAPLLIVEKGQNEDKLNIGFQCNTKPKNDTCSTL